MIIGLFQHHASTASSRGELLTLLFHLEGVEIIPSDGFAERQPNYAVVVTTPRGRIDLGSACKRVSERGIAYLSVWLDAPLLAQPLYAALFHNPEHEKAILVRSQTRPRSEPAAAAA